MVNVARCYYHDTVQVGGQDGDVCKNVRKGLDITLATTTTQMGRSQLLNTPKLHSNARKGRNTSTAWQKRSSSHTSASLLPPSKRTCSSSLTKDRANHTEWDRVHRRVIISDYGKPLCKASSRVAMLAALVGCIEGSESLHTRAGMLQSDLSIGNPMMNEDNNNPSWPAFIIDLDLAIRQQRE